MRESRRDIEELQRVIDRSSERLGPHGRAIMDPNRWSISAKDICEYLQGIRHLAVATVNSKTEPRVAPVDGWFVRGRFVLGSDASSVRMKHLKENPAVSATHYVDDDIAVIVHGRAELIERQHPDAAFLDEVITDLYGSSPFTWGNDVLLARIEPETMLTYSRDFAHAMELNPPMYRR